MKILICDDENNYIEEIKKTAEIFFEENSQTASFDTFTDGDEALKSDLKNYDIAFLDIEIGDIKGTQIADKIKALDSYTLIFFITAYDRYLDDAMDSNAFRFLTKPLDKERLLKGLKTAMDLIDRSVVEFMIKDGETMYKVNTRDVIYVEITGRFTKVVTTHATFMSTNRMEFWQEKLSAVSFYRVHKSFIINSNFITKYTRNDVEMNNEYTVPIAYRLRAPFRQYFLQRVEEIQK